MNQPNTTSAHQNHWIEIKLQSSEHYRNPFRDITLTATFISPSQETLTVPAFWGGDQQWHIRYSANTIGTHTFTTSCSDPSNTGLHAQTGEVHVTEYMGDNPLFKHGAIRVAEDQRHFSHADGKPFFWLGDTWWMGLCKRLSWPQDFQTLTANRKKNGFNVIQIVAGLYSDMPALDPRGLSEPGFAWDADYSSINPAFFDEADQRIQHLVEQGLTPCIVGSWGYHLQWLGVENMRLHWQYIIARWGALPVVWVASGEQTMPWYLEDQQHQASIRETLKQDWSTVMQHIQSLNSFKRLLTTHPVQSAKLSVTDNSLLDFEMQQTGHDNRTQLQANAALKAWYTKPNMPIICGESRYEALTTTSSKSPISTTAVRQAFWAHLINSGLAGHSYGANGIWQVNRQDQPFGASANGHQWGELSWQAAMALPGATQLCIAKTFIETLPWHTLYTYLLQQNRGLPARIIRNNPDGIWSKLFRRLLPNADIETPIAAAKTMDQQLAIYYTITLEPFSVSLTKLQSGISAYWFDPSNGEKININTAAIFRQPFADFVPIGKNADGDTDWLLVIQAAKNPDK